MDGVEMSNDELDALCDQLVAEAFASESKRVVHALARSTQLIVGDMLDSEAYTTWRHADGSTSYFVSRSVGDGYECAEIVLEVE